MLIKLNNKDYPVKVRMARFMTGHSFSLSILYFFIDDFYVIKICKLWRNYVMEVIA